MPPPSEILVAPLKENLSYHYEIELYKDAFDDEIMKTVAYKSLLFGIACIWEHLSNVYYNVSAACDSWFMIRDCCTVWWQ